MYGGRSRAQVRSRTGIYRRVKPMHSADNKLRSSCPDDRRVMQRSRIKNCVTMQRPRVEWHTDEVDRGPRSIHYAEPTRARIFVYSQDPILRSEPHAHVLLQSHPPARIKQSRSLCLSRSPHAVHRCDSCGPCLGTTVDIPDRLQPSTAIAQARD